MGLQQAVKQKIGTNSRFWILLIALVIAGVALMIYITPYGMGLVNDSVGYIGGARNILAGNGYSRLSGNGEPRPITNYPPLFSIAIAAVSLMGLEALRSAWLLNVVLFGANILLIGLAARKASGSDWFGLLGGLFFAASEPLFVAHSYAMSEPIYLFLATLCLLLMGKALQNQHWGWLIAAGVTASLAFLARYVAISLYATAVICLLVFRGEWRKKITDSVIFIVSGIPLAAIWLVRNYLVSSNVGNRMISYHPIPMDKIQEGVLNFWGWLLPERGGLIENHLNLWGIVLAVFLLAWLTAVLVALVLILRGRVGGSSQQVQTGWAFAVEGWVYLAVLVLTLTFVDASPIFEHRILSPFYICVIVLGAAALAWIWQQRRPVGQIIAVVLTLGLLVSFAEDSLDSIHLLHQDGQGFAKSDWLESPTIAAVSQLPETQIYTNRNTALYILTNRPAYVLPSPTNPATQQPREGYAEDVAAIRQQVLDGDAVLVIFGYRTLDADLSGGHAWMQDLTRDLPLIEAFDDDAIFGLSKLD